MTDPTFAQLSAKLAAIHNIASHKRIAFEARLRNLIHLGLIERQTAEGGRGKALTYTPHEVTRFVVGVEMIQAGITPDCVVEAINGHWDTIWEAFMTQHPTGVFLTFAYRALASLTDDPTSCQVECVVGGENIKLSRAVILNVSVIRRRFSPNVQADA